jgi:hypothetical protein
MSSVWNLCFFFSFALVLHTIYEMPFPIVQDMAPCLTDTYMGKLNLKSSHV